MLRSVNRTYWKIKNGELVCFAVDEYGRETQVTWAPQPGSQEAFLSCPFPEALYEGQRGPGKTDALLMDFAQEIGKGYGREWRGVLFRRTFPELGDVIEKAQKWFPLLFKGSSYNKQDHSYHFATGETLLFRHFLRPSDYYSYHGHAYPWIGWEELTTWPTPDCYLSMFSCNRSTKVGLPLRVRATTNPYGIGHNWVKTRWRLPINPGDIIGKVIRDSRDRDGKIEPPRVAIRGYLIENRILLHADKGYVQRIRAGARNHAELRAWIHGDWNIVAGGMFDDVWLDSIHRVPSVPLHLLPRGWKIDRSYDHGSARPFSVGWWAESNGEPFKFNGKWYGILPGDLYRVAEWYGWNGNPNEGAKLTAKSIALGIRDREDDWGIRGRVKPGPADTNIFDSEPGAVSVANEMAEEGVKWIKADKGPGSRKQGWEQMRQLLKNSLPLMNGIRENKGLFVFDNCEHWLRTVPVLPRSDSDLDDVDTESEDHAGDESRYEIRKRNLKPTKRKF